MYNTLVETQRQLEIEVNEQVNNELPSGAFNTFFEFLTNFLYHPDLCPLPEQIRLQMQELFTAVYFAQGGSEIGNDTQRQQCFGNISASFVHSYQQDVLSSLEKSLSDLKLFLNSLTIVEEVVSTVRTHTFTPSCVSALTKLKYCAMCSGYLKFSPCLFLCLNTLRGCVADIAELQHNFGTLLAELTTFADYLAPELQPETIISTSFRSFVDLASELAKTDLKTLVSEWVLA